MKEFYTKPVVEVECYDSVDVITTSYDPITPGETGINNGGNIIDD